MFTCVAVAVSANPASTSTIKATFPHIIKQAWVFDLTALALQDIRQGLFGARRHELEEYTLVSGCLAFYAASYYRDRGGCFTYPIDFSKPSDVIEPAKVWLSFDEGR